MLSSPRALESLGLEVNISIKIIYLQKADYGQGIYIGKFSSGALELSDQVEIIVCIKGAYKEMVSFM